MGRLVRLGALVAALGLAACGGDDGGDEPRATATQPGATTSRPADGRAQFVARLDAVCRDANARARSINRRASAAARRVRGASAQVRAIAPMLEEGVELQRETRRRVAAVTPPSPDDRAYRAILDYLTRQGTLSPRILSAARSGDAARFRTLLAEQARQRGAVQVALRGYGFRECGRGA